MYYVHTVWCYYGFDVWLKEFWSPQLGSWRGGDWIQMLQHIDSFGSSRFSIAGCFASAVGWLWMVEQLLHVAWRAQPSNLPIFALQVLGLTLVEGIISQTRTLLPYFLKIRMNHGLSNISQTMHMTNGFQQGMWYWPKKYGWNHRVFLAGWKRTGVFK